ncbi:MAG: toprim domain-containing protein [Acutalibacteraceae bacterium]
MIKINQAVIVEGKYDKIRLETVIDAPIITTDGFGIFNDKQKQSLIRKIAEKRGIVILTDSDSAGFLIRSKLCGMVPADKITHVYIPELHGKEKRKPQPSKEGLLGVEGVPNDIIAAAFERAGLLCGNNDNDDNRRNITKSDLYELGFCGKENSATLRKMLINKLGFPSHMSANALLNALNILMDYDELCGIVNELQQQNGD